MNESQQMDIKKFILIIIREKYLFIAVSLIVLSSIVWGSYFLTEKYEAKSTVFIEESMIKKMIEGGNRREPQASEALRGLRHSMLSNKVLRDVISALDLDIDANSEAELISLVRHFAANTNIDPRNRENLFIVSFRDKDPKIVRDYVNTLVEKYIDSIVTSKREDAYGASKFIAGQIDYYKDKIEESEERLADFRRKEGIYMATNADNVVNSIKEYMEERDDAEMNIKKLEAKIKKIQQQLSGEKPFSLAMIDNSGANSLPQRLKSLNRQFQYLMTKFTENYPEVIRIKVEIETIKKLMMVGTQTESSFGSTDDNLNMGLSMMNPIYQQLKEALLRTESDLDSVKATQEILSNRIKRSEGELKNIPKNKKVLANLERDKDTYKTLYEGLLSKLGQAEVNEQVEVQSKGETFKIIERAMLPRKPVTPDRVLLILFGILAGIAAGAGIVLLRDKLDSSVKDVNVLKSKFNLNILAVIPEIIPDINAKKKQRFDRRVYSFSVVYLLVIGGVFIKELVGRFF